MIHRCKEDVEITREVYVSVETRVPVSKITGSVVKN